MEFIKGQTSKIGSKANMSAEYRPLTQANSDDDDDDDQVILYMPNGLKKDVSNGHFLGHDSASEELNNLGIKQARVFKKPTVEMRLGQGGVLNRARVYCFGLVLVAALCILAIFLVFHPQSIFKGFNGGMNKHHMYNRTADWNVDYYDYGSESCVRLVDIDDDGRLDIILGVSAGVYFDSSLVSRNSMSKFCEKHDEKYPCVGRVIGIRGYDGKELYRVHTHSNVFEINCDGVDINKDGKKDCIVTGRLGTLTAFNPKDGEVLWHGDGSYLYDFWNTYNALVLSDYDGDGVDEVLIAQGGDPKYPPTEHNRKSGRLIVLSGATGRPLGDRYLVLPETKETYMSPVLHERKDGSQYVLFGHGGETVPGSFLAIAVPDLIRYVKSLPEGEHVPNTKGKYEGWDKYINTDWTDAKILEIYRSTTKGVMVPPLLIDMNGDGVKDILMSAYDGKIILYDGESLEAKNMASFPGYESYSSPAPGYFNNDETIDFMMHFAQGDWPYYKYSLAVILDGNTGKVLWSMNTTMYGMTSVLVLKTQEKYRDAFFYRLQGRMPAVPRERRGAVYSDQYKNYKPGYNYYPADEYNREVEGGKQQSFDYNTLPLPQSEEDSTKSEGGEDLGDSSDVEYDFFDTDAADDNDDDDDEEEEEEILCTDDLDHLTTEMFLMDRTTMTSPIKLFELTARKFTYNMSNIEEQIGSDDRPGYTGDDQNRKRRHFGHMMHDDDHDHDHEQDTDTTCIVLLGDERSTGAIGDVDGDGTLDYIVIHELQGAMLDREGYNRRGQYLTTVSKVNLKEKIQAGQHIPMNPKLAPGLRTANDEKKLDEVGFLPASQQPWLAYMGSKGDSILPSSQEE